MKPENFIAFRNEKFYLSNYYPYAPIVYKEINFPTSEHFFHACKTHDKQQQLLIINSNSPGMAKKNGKVVTLRPDWEEVKVNIMRFTLYLKFTQNSNIMKKLAHEEGELVEYNVWHDNYFGNCTCPKCKKIEGRNILGKLLMELRGQQWI